MKSPMQHHVLGIAARYNDAECEEHGYVEIVSKLGLKVEDVFYIAEQRAIRMLYIAEGRDMSVFKGTEMQPMNFSQEERARLAIFTTACVDGIMIGWRARELESRDEG